MLLYGHRGHVYEDRATKRTYQVPRGGYVEIPDEVGVLLLRAHPDKLCDVTGEPNPQDHKCEKTELAANTYPTTAIGGPPQATVMQSRISPQRRKKLQEVRHRSGIARRNSAVTKGVNYG